jgi:uncharacterized protein YbjT (DUF2867 family)
MILIVGASGRLAGEVAPRLIAMGKSLRLLTRRPAGVTDLQRAGVEVVEGDLITPGSLERACQGVEQVFASAHSMLGKGEYRSAAVDDTGHCALIDAARRAGVAHFVYTSLYGASPDHPVDFWRTKYKVEQFLKASGLSYTILRPTAFMEAHAHLFNGKAILETGKTSLLGAGTKPRNFVAVRDVAHFAILAFTTELLQGRTLDIGGPGNFSNNQVSELYGQIAGIVPRINHMPPFLVKLMSILARPFHPGISRIMYINSLPDDAFDECFDPALLLAEFPVQLTSLETFIRERVLEMKTSTIYAQP